jgi:hypothetical protein
MNRWVCSVLLFAFLFAPGASAGLFSHKNAGPKINYKTKYVAQKYKVKKFKSHATKFHTPKGTHPPTR